MDNPWETFEKTLNLTYVKFMQQGWGNWNWREEKDLVYRSVIRGMAINSPAPPPPPNSPKYPLRLLLQQLITWFKKVEFPPPAGSTKTPRDSLLLDPQSDFRQYIIFLWSVFGWLLSQLTSKHNEGDDEEDQYGDAYEDDMDSKQYNDDVEDTKSTTTTTTTTATAKTTTTTTDDWEGGVAVETDSGAPSSSSSSASSTSASSAVPPANDACAFIDPIVPLFSEAISLLVQGIAPVLHEETKKSLYDRYKGMTPGASVGVNVSEEIFQMLEAWAPPMAEFLGPSAIARRHLRSQPGLLESSVHLRIPDKRGSIMVYQLINLLDPDNTNSSASSSNNTTNEDVIIIHAPTKKGLLCGISGCSDNKILGMAIAKFLVKSKEKKEAELFDGERPPKEIQDLLTTETPQMLEDDAIQYAHQFTFSCWTIVKPDGTVPTGMAGASHWFWAEGVPREIPVWNGHRVIILGKAPFPKKFTPVRVFASLEASVTVKKVYTDAEVGTLLQNMGNADSTLRDAAVAAHKKWKE